MIKKIYIYYAIAMCLLYDYLLHCISYKYMNRRASIDEITSGGFINCFTHPFSFEGVRSGDCVLCFCIILMLCCFIVLKGLNKRPKVSSLSDNGWLAEEERKAFLKNYTEPYGRKRISNLNLVCANDIYIGLDNKITNMNTNILGIGGSGKGKSHNFVIPNMLRCNSNYVITDPSGELMKKCGKYMEDQGYKIKCINVQRIYESNRYNPFHYIREETDVFIMIDTFIKNTKGKGDKCGEDFWIKAESLLLYAVCLYLWHCCPEEEQHFGNVLKLVHLEKVCSGDEISELHMLFNDLKKQDPGNLAVSLYEEFLSAADKTMSSILISVFTRLTKIESKKIQWLMEQDELQLETFADSKQVLFVRIPTGDDTFNFIVSMMYSQLFMVLYDYAETTCSYGYRVTANGYQTIKTFQAKNENESVIAEKSAYSYLNKIKKSKIVYDKEKSLYVICNNGLAIDWRGDKESCIKARKELIKHGRVEKCGDRCPNHVRMILDEFANIGKIPDFDNKLSTIRKYEISCCIILQNIAQLERDYKDDFDSIVSNCDTKLLLGSNDLKTLKWFSELLGKKEITVRSESYQSNHNGSESYSKQLVDLMPVENLRKLEKDKCIVVMSSQKPFIGDKYHTLEDPLFKESTKTIGKLVIRKPTKEQLEQEKPFRLRESTTVSDNNTSSDVNDSRKVIIAQNEARKTESRLAKEALEHIDDENNNIEVFGEDLMKKSWSFS
ncbi:MAG: type IV secretory system conjugative DNA transfer family protein [Lachnospiraceae bacterium]|nr:type IV secretory system conjugative DNA transfer family protein [Lachnospiraceae bacterium]